MAGDYLDRFARCGRDVRIAQDVFIDLP